MEKFVATTYAMRFAECNETDTLFKDTYSPNDLMVNLIEEMGELSAAISKYNRTRGIGPITPVTEEEALNNLKEELSDVLGISLILAEKMGWIDELIETHKKKSEKCAKRIKDRI